MSADFWTVMAGACVAGTVTDDWAWTRVPSGAVPVTVAVFVTPPASTSACVVVYVATQVTEPPGASDVTPWQSIEDSPGRGSVSEMGLRLTFPVLLTR